MKICKDCRHYQPDGTGGLHGGARCTSEVDPIEGRPVFCDSSRRCDSYVIDQCGLDAAHFEPSVGGGLPDLSRIVRIVEADAPRPWWRFWA